MSKALARTSQSTVSAAGISRQASEAAVDRPRSDLSQGSACARHGGATSVCRDNEPMRIFLAGATGVLGVRLVPLLVEAGHQVAGMTRSAHKVEQLRTLGATPVVCDAFDREGVQRAVRDFRTECVLNELT